MSDYILSIETDPGLGRNALVVHVKGEVRFSSAEIIRNPRGDICTEFLRYRIRDAAKETASASLLTESVLYVEFRTAGDFAKYAESVEQIIKDYCRDEQLLLQFQPREDLETTKELVTELTQILAGTRRTGPNQGKIIRHLVHSIDSGIKDLSGTRIPQKPTTTSPKIVREWLREIQRHLVQLQNPLLE